MQAVLTERAASSPRRGENLEAYEAEEYGNSPQVGNLTQAEPSAAFTHANLAIILMNDPNEVEFFEDLSAKLVTQIAPGNEFIELLADAVSEIRTAHLTATFYERLALIFATAAHSNELADLALRVLPRLKERTEAVADDAAERAIIESLDYLSRFEPHLTFKQRAAIFSLGIDSTPVGQLKAGLPDFSDITREPNRPVDLVGAGCLLLLAKFSNATLSDVAACFGLPLEKRAIIFSKRHPTRPNLYITAMRDAAPEALRNLDELQRSGVSKKETFAMAKSVAAEMLSASFVLTPLLKSVVDAAFNRAKGQLWLSAAATLVSVGFLGTLRFSAEYLKQSRKNSLSGQHKQQLARAVQPTL